jgi:glycogen debranching enzyme
MSGQPWLHEFVTVLSAPTAVLSEGGGQIRPGGAQGALHADTRILSEAVLEVGGAEPAAVSGGLLGADAALFIGVPRNLGAGQADPLVRVERERHVAPGFMRERVRLANTSEEPVGTDVVIRLAADMAGISQIKAGKHGRPAPVTVAADGTGGTAARVSWGTGPLRVQVSAPGATVSVGSGRVALRWPVRLAGRGSGEVTWELTASDPAAVVTAAPAEPARGPGVAAHGGPGVAAHGGPGGTAGSGRPWPAVRAESDDPRLPRLLAQSLSDAAALRMATTLAPRDVFLAAGAPWYLTLFGRDSIWAARLLLPFGWQLAAGTLRALAALQGQRLDPGTGEAPGKIPHELRAGGRRASGGRGRLPSLYYGTIDATPLWICLLHDAWRWGMPEADVRALLPNLTAALACLRDYGDADGDGLLEYIDESGRGLANQGWKDSGDSVRFADGRIAAPPVALCEVQAYAYEAAMGGAALLEAFGQPGAGQWRAWASGIATAFRAAYWVSGPDGPYPALALDMDKRPVDSLTSNAGHLLGTGLLTGEEEGLVAARLAGPDMDSGFGLRTMSAASGGYSPLSYHCGSVWSHDTAIVVRGLARAGHRRVAASLTDGLLEAAAAFGWRLPELFSGESRAEVPWPSPYPASCRPQAWAAAAVGGLVQALLGLEVDVPSGTAKVAPLLAGSRRPGGGTRVHVDGLVAGETTFSAGIGVDGRAYLEGLSLRRERAGGAELPAGAGWRG